MTALDTLAGLDKFYVRQKFALMINEYKVSTIDSDGKEAEPLAFVRQKRMKIREELNFFGDEAQSEHLLRLKAKKVFEFRGRTDVTLSDGTVIGQLQKAFGKSLLRSSWEILDADGNEIATAREKSMPMAVIRRIWGQIPVIGDVPFFIPFHFEIRIGDQRVGTYERPVGLTDRYVMDLTGDPEKKIDRRVAMAFAIALDALQDR